MSNMQVDVSAANFKNEREFCEFFIRFANHVLTGLPTNHQTARELVYLRDSVRVMLAITDKTPSDEVYSRRGPL